MNILWTLAVILGLWVTSAKANSAAVGDSLAVGFGGASHMSVYAKVGASSCVIRWYVPSHHFDGVLISAGTNDVPGRCVASVRARVAKLMTPSRVMWVVPVNGSRGTVLAVARKWGDELFYYVAQRGRGWPHPHAYRNVGL
jgi:hypothetical protein